MRWAAGICLCIFAGSVFAQGTPEDRSNPARHLNTRVPKGGAAPILDMRIQDAGITLPRGVQEQQDGVMAPPEPPASPATPPRAAPGESPAPETSGNNRSR